MTLLDRYVCKQFIRNMLLVFGSLISIYLLIDFFERIDNFSEANKPMGLAVRYFIYKIPLIYDQLIPICIMLASILTLGLFNHHKELQAFKACGISLTRMSAPVVGIALFFTVISLAVAQWLLPMTISETNRIWHEEVKQEVHSGIVRNDITYYKGIEGIYSFHRPDPAKHEFSQFTYLARTDHFDLKLLINAKKANWRDGGWNLTKGQIKKKSGAGFDIEIFQTSRFELPDKIDDFFVPAYQVDELSLSQLLLTSIQDWRQGDRQGWVDFNRRLSYIFLGIPLMLIGIPIVLHIQQSWGRDLTMAVPVSCGLAFVAWGMWSASQAMTNAAYLNPVPASWLIHFIVAALGIFLIRLQDR